LTGGRALALRFLNGSLDLLRWHLKRNGEGANEGIASFELTSGGVFKSPQTLGYVFVAAATDHLHRTQAEFGASAGNENLNRKLFFGHGKSSISVG
jgi:hypothetical protein